MRLFAFHVLLMTARTAGICLFSSPPNYLLVKIGYTE